MTGSEATLKYPVQVVVLGTEERSAETFQKHTVYVVEVSISKIAIKLFLRYSEIIKMADKYRKFHPKFDVAKFPNDEWLTNHKTIVIEQRRISIEGFIQAVLQFEQNHRKDDGKYDILQELCRGGG